VGVAALFTAADMYTLTTNKDLRASVHANHTDMINADVRRIIYYNSTAFKLT
jgi:hypothetical protein